MKILIIEDESSLRELISDALFRVGHVVECAATFGEAIEKLECYSYDCILLDIMLPDGSGMQILNKIRHHDKRESVIIISAKDSLDDKIFGLESGADDYLAKPFHLAELTARIHSVERRRRGGSRQGIVLGNVVLDPERRKVEISGQEIPLLRKEFEILSYFMQRPEHMVDKAVLAEAVWGDSADQADDFHFIYSQMKNLRRKLKDFGSTVEIKAVYGFGYRLVVNNSADI